MLNDPQSDLDAKVACIIDVLAACRRHDVLLSELVPLLQEYVTPSKGCRAASEKDCQYPGVVMEHMHPLKMETENGKI